MAGTSDVPRSGVDRKARPKMVFLRLVSECLYCFEEGHINGWDAETVIDDWFGRYPLDMYHAARNGHQVGNTERVIGVQEITEAEADAYAVRPDPVALRRRAEEEARKRREESSEFLVGFYHDSKESGR